MKSLLYADMSKNDIAKRLLEISKEKLLVKRVVHKYKNNSFYSTIFNEEEVESELYNTIASVINVLERYNKNQVNLILKNKISKMKFTKKETEEFKNKNFSEKFVSKINKNLKTDLSKEEINQILEAEEVELKLNKESDITGYLIAAFTNNIKKIYGKYNFTDKRSFSQMVYLDSSLMKNKSDSIGSVDFEKEKDFNGMLVDMALYLRKIDKKNNQVNNNKKSQLAKLFCSIVNSKKVEDNDELRKRFGWSQYLLNKNKEVLIKKIQEEFGDCKEEIISYLDERENFRKAC